MNYKKKSLILSTLLIICIQILLLINNKQKTSFRFFIWNIQDISIGNLICIPFVTGFLISSILNKTRNNNLENYSVIEEDKKKSSEKKSSINNNDNVELNEKPPERDIRDPQPTISVNYRFISDNDDYEIKDRDQTIKKNQYQDDWNDNSFEW